MFKLIVRQHFPYVSLLSETYSATCLFISPCCVFNILCYTAISIPLLCLQHIVLYPFLYSPFVSSTYSAIPLLCLQHFVPHRYLYTPVVSSTYSAIPLFLFPFVSSIVLYPCCIFSILCCIAFSIPLLCLQHIVLYPCCVFSILCCIAFSIPLLCLQHIVLYHFLYSPFVSSTHSAIPLFCL